jgi:hypothetical protein
VDDNYNLSIPKWVDENYPRNFVYAQVNILEEALLISTKKIEKIQNIEVTILRI